MNITVYLGANEGNDPFIAESARELGAWIGKSGNNLVYGGSKVGTQAPRSQALSLSFSSTKPCSSTPSRALS